MSNSVQDALGRDGLQLFHPAAVAEFAIRVDALTRPFTLPYSMSPADKGRLIALLLAGLRAGGAKLGSLLRLRWEERARLNSSQPPSITCRREDVLWLIVSQPVADRELFGFMDDCDCLTLIDFRCPNVSERVRWLGELKNALLDAARAWWRQSVRHPEADKVNFTRAAEWFESPLDALDYCNAVAGGLFRGNPLSYAERRALSDILAAKTDALTPAAVAALLAYPFRTRWNELPFAMPLPLPDFSAHFAGWQAAGLGRAVGDEFLPLPAVEEIANPDIMELFILHWRRDDPAAAPIYQLWEVLCLILRPPSPDRSERAGQTLERTARPVELLVLGGTCGTPSDIRKDIGLLFPNLPPDADDLTLQSALLSETDPDRRLLLLAWRATLWLDEAQNENASVEARRRAEAAVARAIADQWRNLRPTTDANFARHAALAWARLRCALADHLSERARITDAANLLPRAIDHFTHATIVLRAIGGRLGEANCIRALGDVHRMLAEYEAARGRYEEALPIYRQIGDRLGEANCIQALGDVHRMLAEYEAARGRYEEALPIHRQIGDRLGEANCIQALGDVHRMLAEYEAARGRYEEALPIHRQIGDRLGEANCIQALGDVHRMLAEYEAARGRYEEALPIHRQIGDRLGEANCIQALGDVHRMLAEYEAARGRYEEALPIYRQIGARLGEMNCVFGLADLDRPAEQWAAAEEKYRQALEYYRSIGIEFNVAFTLQRLGHAAKGAGDRHKAQHYYREALELFTKIGSPSAKHVQADLDGLSA